MATIIKHQFTITYESSIDSETGEILETKIVSKTEPKVTKTKVVSGDPKLVIDTNKYTLTSSAAAALGVEPDDKIDIKYQPIDGVTRPVIGSDLTWGTKQGNRLTKSLTVALRGAKHDELIKYGFEFNLMPHPKVDGLFILDSGKEIVREEPNEKINTDDVDLDLEGLIDHPEATEVDSKSLFQL